MTDILDRLGQSFVEAEARQIISLLRVHLREIDHALMDDRFATARRLVDEALKIGRKHER